MNRRIWLLACLLLLPLVLAIGIGVGVMLPRVSLISAPSTPPLSQSAGGVRVEELKADEELFALVDQQAIVFKYFGGDVDFWIELERDGETQRFNLISLWRQKSDAPAGPNDQVEGHFVFCRMARDESGNERWVLAGRRESISTKSSGLKVSTPLVEGEVAESKENRQAVQVNSSATVSLWKEQKKSEGFSKQSLAENADPKRPRTSRIYCQGGSTDIPRPLPTDRNVCIKTITEEGKKVHPTDKDKELVAKHIIRVMCKVASDEANGKE